MNATTLHTASAASAALPHRSAPSPRPERSATPTSSWATSCGASIILFVLGVVVGIGAIVGGRIFGMPHASKAGVVGVVVVFVAVIGYLVLPGIVRAMTGSGCV